MKVEFWYKIGGQQKYAAKRISAGYTLEYFLPSGATDVRLLVYGIGTTDKEKLDKNFPFGGGLRKAYRAHGTIFNVAFRKITPFNDATPFPPSPFNNGVDAAVALGNGLTYKRIY